MSKKARKPLAGIGSARVLVIDIETAPMLGYVWSLWQQDVAINQIHSDWHVLSYAAKWLGEDKIFYRDQRNEKRIENDKPLLKEVWKLLDKADVVVGQNTKAFDVKKINARLLLNGLKPPSSYRQIDTKVEAKKNFALSSVKLEYMAKNICPEHSKDSHKRFPGFELWLQCMAGNKEAWKEMERYNKADVLATEALFWKMSPWINFSFDAYIDDESPVCICGSTEFRFKGYQYNNHSKKKRWICKKCGKGTKSQKNLLSKEKRASIRTS